MGKGFIGPKLVPQEVKSHIVEVEKLVYIDKPFEIIKEVPKEVEKIVERLVEVEKIVEKQVEVPVEKLVEKIVYVDKELPVYVPQPVQVEKIVEIEKKYVPKIIWAALIIETVIIILRSI